MNHVENVFERVWAQIALLNDLNPQHRQATTAHFEKLLSPWARWPRTADLLWPKCVRQPFPYDYPARLVAKLTRCSVQIDTRMSNGPGRTAFQAAGGSPPSGWRCHHVYDGSYIAGLTPKRTLGPLVQQPDHFTQSAGIVALHPQADRAAHGNTDFGCFLRLFAFARFGYDPELTFRIQSDKYGFVSGFACKVW